MVYGGNNMHRVITLLLLIAICLPSQSQNNSLSGIKAELDLLFSSLDKSKVPTGFLWDTAVNLVEREDFNGAALTDSNCVSISLMGDLLYSINSASVGADTIGVQAALSRIQRNSVVSQQMVGFLFQPYNYIIENALTDNLIIYANDRVSDSYIGGVWQNPYDEDVLFGYAIGGETTVYTNTTFTITNIDSLSVRSFQSIMFDPGDGGGFRTVSMSGTVTATYMNTGYRETKLKVVYGGHEYISHGMINVVPPPHNNTSGFGSSSLLDWEDFTYDTLGTSYKARVCYRLPLCFDNPLIVSEGFDPWKLTNDSIDHNYSGSTYYSRFVAEASEVVDLSSFNIFYIDWFNYGADIRINAELLKQIIQWVNDNKTSGNKNVVLGQSMGGLIARYSLCKMEQAREPHDTKLFISHDVPHMGANVSPGLMFSYRDIIDVYNNQLIAGVSYLSGQLSSFTELTEIGNHMSVKQMLSNYVNSSWNYDFSIFNQFQTSLLDMGFPKGDPGFPIENVAIINGGRRVDGSLSLHSSGDHLLDIHLSTSANALLGAIIRSLYSYSEDAKYASIPGKTTLRYELKAFPFLSNGALVHRMKISYTKKFLWLLPKNYVIKDISHYSPLSGSALDGVSASYYDLWPIEEYKEELDSLVASWFPNPSFSFELAKRIAFIPTASAFASTDYSRDFRTNHPAPKIDTPFTSYIMPDTTTYHTSFYSGIGHWLETVEGMSIDGPLMPESGDVYSMPSGYTSSFSWSTSASNIASISSSGVLTVSGNGLVDIIAWKDSATYVVSKRKTVMAGLPRMAITSNHSGTEYSLRAEFIDDGVEDFLSRTHLTDSIMRKWYLVVGGERIDSTFNYKDTASFTVADSIRIASVTLFLNYNGRTSDPVHYVIKEKRSYIWNVQSIWRMEDGAHYFLNVRFRPDNDNPPFFKMKSNPLETNTPLPAKLKATAGNTILRTTGDLEIVNGVVIWDLFTETAVLSLINLAYRTDQVKQLIIEVYSDMEETDATLVQTIVIPIHPVVPPIPLEM